jgi:hypothetical protein
MVNVLSLATVAASLASAASLANAESMRSEAAAMPSGAWPAYNGNATPYSEPYTVKKGEVFDGKMKVYQRSNIKCTDDNESGKATAVFLVDAGGTLKNVVIGANQREGVHCEQSGCVIENVWWDDVCEDALSIKGGSASSVSKVIGGGARSGQDKLIQHNGLGLVQIEGFYAQDFGKLYRSCGTCGNKARKVSVTNVYAVNPGVSIVTVNENYGDQATLSNIKIKNGAKKPVCQWGTARASGDPINFKDGVNPPICSYSPSTISYV